MFLKKTFEKTKNENFETLTVPKTREGGPFGLFETSVCCKISKNLKGDRLATKENSKKVAQCRKKFKGGTL